MGRFMSATGGRYPPGFMWSFSIGSGWGVFTFAQPGRYRVLGIAEGGRGGGSLDFERGGGQGGEAGAVRDVWGELHVNEGDSFRAMYYNITGRARSLRFERDAGSGIYVVALGGYDGESNVVTGNGVAGAAGDSSSLAPFNAFGKRFEAGAGGAGGSSGGGGNPSNGGGNGGAGGIKILAGVTGDGIGPSAPAADGGLDLPYGGAGGTGIGAGGGGSPGSYSATTGGNGAAHGCYVMFVGW